MALSQIKLPEEQPNEGFSELSTQESRAFKEQRDLENEAEASQHDRREKIRDTIAEFVNIWISVAAAGAIVTTVVWIFHLLAPISWHWLSSAELSSIKDTLSNVVIGAVFGFLVKQKFV